MRVDKWDIADFVDRWSMIDNDVLEKKAKATSERDSIEEDLFFFSNAFLFP